MLKYLNIQHKGYWFMLIASIISITIITASQLFTNKISRLLDLQASELLAADALIVSSNPIPDALIKKAKAKGLNIAHTVTLRTAVFINDEMQLIELKAVDNAYPLRGYLETKNTNSEQPVRAKQGPKVGNLWVDQQIADYLNQTIELGSLNVTATKILSLEPDRGGSLFNVAPRMMIHLQDLDKTQLILPGSRAKYFALFSGEERAVNEFVNQIKPQLTKEQTLQSLKNARPEMRTALERIRHFFALGMIMTLVIAMAAIALSARYVVSLEASKVAVMRVFGVDKLQLLKYYLTMLFKLWFIALPIAWLLGWLFQQPIEWMLGQWFSQQLPSSGIQPYAIGALYGFIGLFGFSLPFIVALLKVSPNQVLRAHQWQVQVGQMSLFFGVVIVLSWLLYLLIQDIKLTIASVVVVVGLSLIIPLFIKGILVLTKRFMRARFWLSGFLLSRLLNKQRNSLFVMTAFMLTVLAVLIVGIVKDDLFSDWQAMLKDDTPNFFAINIEPQQVDSLNDQLKQTALSSSGMYPIVNARIATINEIAIEEIQFTKSRAEHFKNHVFKISASEQLPDENEIIEGVWPPQNNQVSIAKSMAEILNIKLGDTIGFDVAGQRINVLVNSVRDLVWENFKPNFYVLASQRLLEPLPKTYIMSVFIPPQKNTVLADWHKLYPSITWLDITQIMTRIKHLIDQSTLALEFFFLFAIVSGVVVLLSSVSASQQQRIEEIALLKVLGLNQSKLLKAQLLEFVLMGLFVGILASLFASICAGLVSVLLLDLHYVINPLIWLIGVVISVLILSATGYFAIQSSLKTSPVKLLRSA